MVMLNFHKISLRPLWSIFIIYQKPKIIFKSKASSKQKRVKKTQEHEIGQFATEHFARRKDNPPWRANGEQVASSHWDDPPRRKCSPPW
ncbi:hypothetical protein MTR_0413s0050 [Medicago truncatula]|uniref:Uncharacterized protein n=1 Tax=Medicago truncatula TaxID=3880 RepID=A0A072TEJ4_MEDTR|nr:hypothetical protein MTR_0413s0050 [Medicago truncatula]